MFNLQPPRHISTLHYSGGNQGGEFTSAFGAAAEVHHGIFEARQNPEVARTHATPPGIGGTHQGSQAPAHEGSIAVEP